MSIEDALGEPPLSDRGWELALAELKFHHDRVAAGSDIVSTIGQFIFVIFGAIIVASLKVPQVIGVLPLFWSAWLPHAQQREADTAKHALLARRLEAQLNRASGGKPVSAWTSALTSGSPASPSPIASAANFVFWAFLYGLSWVATIVVFLKLGEWPFAVSAIAVGTAVSSIAIVGFVRDTTFKSLCAQSLQDFVDAWN